MMFARINGKIYPVPGVDKENLTSDDVEAIRKHMAQSWGVTIHSFQMLEPSEVLCVETCEGLEYVDLREYKYIDKRSHQQETSILDFNDTLEMNPSKKARCVLPGTPERVETKENIQIPGPINKQIPKRACIQDVQIAGPSRQPLLPIEDAENVEAEDDGGRWTAAATKLFLVERLRIEEDFKKGVSKRITMYGKLAKILAEAGYPGISPLDCLNKFKSLMATYRRNAIKKQKSGESAITCQYFQIMDDVYGHRDSVNVPLTQLKDTLGTSLRSAEIPAEVEPASEAIYARRKKTQKTLNPTIAELIQQRTEADEQQREKENKYMEESLRLQQQRISHAAQRNAMQNEIRDILRQLLTHFERLSEDSGTQQ